MTAKLHHKQLAPEIDALYVAEMARSFFSKKFGEEAISNGYKIFTTLDSHLQAKANLAVRKTLFEYDERHGFKGVLDHVSIPKGIKDVEKWAHKKLSNYAQVGDLIPSLVLKTRSRSIVAYNALAGQFKIAWRDIVWARRYLRDDKLGRPIKRAISVVKRGDIIMVRPLGTRRVQGQKSLDDKSSVVKPVRWRLSQIPEIEGALVSLNPNNGAITALVGGFDFYRSKFNRVTQAKRQAGSTFKPFIYSAALKEGFSTSSIVNDAPIVYRVDGELWRPQNYTERYYGETNLTTALAHSYNVSAVRLLDQLGVKHAINHVTKFGFERDEIPNNLTTALGTGVVTPLKLAASFAVFSNGGFRIQPYFIDRIEDLNGNILFAANPLTVCRQCPPEILASKQEEHAEVLVSHQVCSPTPRYAPRAIDTPHAYTMTAMLQEVIRNGTGRNALQLKRRDIAGKTGTTDDQRDAWFAGYTPDVVTVVWVGFDQPRSLGEDETGSKTALPMWVKFMKAALEGQREKPLPKRYNLAQYEENGLSETVLNEANSSQSRFSDYKESTVIPETEQLF